MTEGKLTVPQVSEITGVSGDYFNEYAGRGLNLELGLLHVAELFRLHPVRRYELVYPPSLYGNVITAKNQHNVQRLNHIAEVVNLLFTDANQFSELDFKLVINRVQSLVYGEGRDASYPEVVELVCANPNLETVLEKEK